VQWDLRASDLLRRDVCLNGIRLGVPVDVLLERDRLRVLGLDVLCGDRNHRFLPLAACDLEEGHIVVDTALALMTEERGFYRERGRSLASLRGLVVRRGGRTLGPVADVTVAPDGKVSALVVEGDDGELEVALGADLVIDYDGSD